MAERTELLIIDPQVDFCDPNGSLPVTNADKDMKRLASMIVRFSPNIKEIRITLDCHHLIDVAHPPMWRNSAGKHPDPFTLISSQDIKDGKWLPVIPSLTLRFIEYTEKLEAGGKYALIIWPPHCIIGYPGNNVFPALRQPLNDWQERSLHNVVFVSKGSNAHTEHYGAIEAEVPDETDPGTQVNTGLINALMQADTILVAGEAGSHCLKTTLEQIADKFGNDEYLKKIVLLTDATSPVLHPDIDFPGIQAQFIKDMEARGMRVALTTDF